MDRDDAGTPDRSDEARQGDTGMIGSEAEEPGPGRDTSLTEPDPVAAGTEQPQTTVAMSEGDPARTRLGSHVEGAGVIGYDVAASEEGTTQETPPEDRPAYAPEGDPGLAAEPVVDQGSYGQPGDASYQRQTAAGYEGEPGGAGMAGDQEEPGQDVPATYTGEEADVAGRPEYAERAEGGADQALYQEEPQRMDRPGGGGSLFTDETPEQADRPGPQEPGVQEGVYDQDADQARRQRPSDGL